MRFKEGEFRDITLIDWDDRGGTVFQTEKKHTIARIDDEGGVYIPPSMVEKHGSRLFLIQEVEGKIILSPMKLHLEIAEVKNVNSSIVTPPSSEEVAQVK